MGVHATTPGQALSDFGVDLRKYLRRGVAAAVVVGMALHRIQRFVALFARLVPSKRLEVRSQQVGGGHRVTGWKRDSYPVPVHDP